MIFSFNVQGDGCTLKNICHFVSCEQIKLLLFRLLYTISLSIYPFPRAQCLTPSALFCVGAASSRDVFFAYLLENETTVMVVVDTFETILHPNIHSSQGISLNKRLRGA